MSEWMRVKRSSLQSVADKIKAKGGTETKLSFPNGFNDAIDAIEIGGDSEFGSDFPLKDGKSHYWIERVNEDTTPYFAFRVTNPTTTTLTIDWGDGTVEDWVGTGASQLIEHNFPVGQFRIDITNNGNWQLGQSTQSGAEVPMASRTKILYMELFNVAFSRGALRSLYKVKKMYIDMNGRDLISLNGFSCNVLEELIIKNGNLTLAKTEGIFNCPLITEIPNNLFTYTNSSVFENCQNLSSTKSINWIDESMGFGMYAFRYCYNLTYAEIPPKVTSVGNQCFQGCYYLKTVKFLGTPTSISATCFQGLTQEMDIYVPWAEGEVANAPWGATNATIHYNHTEESEV